jgi:tetratricopeptide (TPR) repeat protein
MSRHCGAVARGASARPFLAGGCLAGSVLAVAVSTLLAVTAVPARGQSRDAGELLAQLDNPPNRFEYARLATGLGAAADASRGAAAARLRLAQLQAQVRAGDRKAAAATLAVLAPLRNSGTRAQQLELQVAQANLDGDPRAEIEALEAIAKLRPQDRWVRYDIARAWGELEDFRRSVESARQALALGGPAANWEASWIHYLHSKSAFRGGDAREAIAAADAGRNERTTWRSTLYRRAIGEFAAGDEAAGKRSLEEYVRYAREEGRTSEAMLRFNLGVFWHELGRTDEAERELLAGRALEPDNGYGLWALGYVLIDRPGGVAEGLALIDRALAKRPDDRMLVAARGWALYRAGRLPEALAELEHAEKLGGGWDQRLTEQLGEVRAAIADPKRPPAPRTRWL